MEFGSDDINPVISTKGTEKGIADGYYTSLIRPDNDFWVGVFMRGKDVDDDEDRRLVYCQAGKNGDDYKIIYGFVLLFISFFFLFLSLS